VSPTAYSSDPLTHDVQPKEQKSHRFQGAEETPVARGTTKILPSGIDSPPTPREEGEKGE